MEKTDDKTCLITLYLDTPKPMMLPFRDIRKHNQFVSMACTNQLDPVAITGHAFIGLADESGIEKRAGYTFEDAGFIKSIFGAKGCVCEEDENSPHNEAIVWRISKDQYNKAMKAIDEKRENPGQYKLFETNCSTFAVDILNAAGVPDVPSGKFALSPAGLVMKKRLMQAQRNVEVLKYKLEKTFNKLFGDKKMPTKESLETLRDPDGPIMVSINQTMKHARKERKEADAYNRDRYMYDLLLGRAQKKSKETGEPLEFDRKEPVKPIIKPIDISKLISKNNSR
ncbi:MAG: hypothetical protein MJ247_03650 [Alphaproteobacteria bacterium]|nr:hypothetical protein [Alphaproteobacteria bacterium]